MTTKAKAKAKGKPRLTQGHDGHSHTIDNDAGDSGYTSNDDDGSGLKHEHPWVRLENGEIKIGEVGGHTHVLHDGQSDLQSTKAASVDVDRFARLDRLSREVSPDYAIACAKGDAAGLAWLAKRGLAATAVASAPTSSANELAPLLKRDPTTAELDQIADQVEAAWAKASGDYAAGLAEFLKSNRGYNEGHFVAGLGRELANARDAAFADCTHPAAAVAKALGVDVEIEKLDIAIEKIEKGLVGCFAHSADRADAHARFEKAAPDLGKLQSERHELYCKVMALADDVHQHRLARIVGKSHATRVAAGEVLVPHAAPVEKAGSARARLREAVDAIALKRGVSYELAFFEATANDRHVRELYELAANESA